MEEKIIYQDNKYIFYENRIYSKTRWEYLKRYKGGVNAHSPYGFITGKNYWWSYLGVKQDGKRKFYRAEFPLTLERLSKIYKTK
tara:strand:+ start:561 stop:812 length:252 start_codon:yes stop_codon:yes gene_type:complete